LSTAGETLAAARRAAIEVAQMDGRREFVEEARRFMGLISFFVEGGRTLRLWEE
jgi:hypothetical protein